MPSLVEIILNYRADVDRSTQGQEQEASKQGSLYQQNVPSVSNALMHKLPWQDTDCDLTVETQ